MKEIRPQPKQEAFLASPADICFTGGAAGSGKTFAILLESVRHIQSVNGFGVTIFRAESTQIHSIGGLWDTSEELYPLLKATPIKHRSEWSFPPHSNRVAFRHLTDRDLLGYQGAQIPLIIFDELTHISRKAFMYMLSRNRSMTGIKPYVRATFNPVPKTDPFAGYIHEWIDWYLDSDGRYPDYSKSGILRWFIVRDDNIIWRDNKEDFEPTDNPLSFTFIPAKLEDNQKLIEQDPLYKSKLEALGTVDRARLLDSDFLVEDMAGGMFKREDFEIVPDYPKGGEYTAYIDKAGTQGGGDYTAIILLYKHKDTYYVVDAIKGQWSAGNREKVIQNTAIAYKKRYGHVRWWTEQEPGSGGKESAEYTIRKTLAGFSCKADKVSQNKTVRAEPVASQTAIGNVKLVEGEWNIPFIQELLRFPKKPRDWGDAFSGAFNMISNRKTVSVLF